MAALCARPKVDTITDPYPRATKAAANVIELQVGIMSTEGKGPRKMKAVAKIMFPTTDTTEACVKKSQS